MVRIRLRRMGSKRQPSYRIVVCDKESPRDGAFIEIVGTYNPRTNPESYSIVEGSVLKWLKVGAQPSDAVARLLKANGTADRLERLKKGEALETLVAEAAAAVAARPPIDPRTKIGRKPLPKPKKAAPAEAAEAAAE
jgi:small subunit ribosomal protein S16